jgi:hypothetical protein
MHTAVVLAFALPSDGYIEIDADWVNLVASAIKCPGRLVIDERWIDACTKTQSRVDCGPYLLSLIGNRLFHRNASAKLIEEILEDCAPTKTGRLATESIAEEPQLVATPANQPAPKISKSIKSHPTLKPKSFSGSLLRRSDMIASKRGRREESLDSSQTASSSSERTALSAMASLDLRPTTRSSLASVKSDKEKNLLLGLDSLESPAQRKPKEYVLKAKPDPEVAASFQTLVDGLCLWLMDKSTNGPRAKLSRREYLKQLDATVSN